MEVALRFNVSAVNNATPWINQWLTSTGQKTYGAEGGFEMQLSKAQLRKTARFQPKINLQECILQ